MFEPFQKFLNKTAARYGLATELQAAKICHDFKILIPQLFQNKETPEKYLAPAYFKRNTLVISTASAAWAQEVIMRKPQIIEEMNKKAGKKIIKNLRTILKQA